MAADGPQSSGPRLFKEGCSRYPQLPSQVIVHLPEQPQAAHQEALALVWKHYPVVGSFIGFNASPFLSWHLPKHIQTKKKSMLPSTCGSHRLFFHRFYAENITHLKDIITIELFFLNSKCAVYNVSSSFERMKHDSAQLLICLAEHLLMIHSLWTLTACQLSRHSLQGISFSEKTAEKNNKRRRRRGHLRAWYFVGDAGLESSVAVHDLCYSCIFFLQEIIEVESENVFKLAANALQVSVKNACSSVCCTECDSIVFWREIFFPSPGGEWKLHQVWAH